MISQNQGDCFISKSRFCDITQYVEFVEFSIDKMMTPMQKKKKKKKKKKLPEYFLDVNWRTPFFYFPADTKFRASALIICSSYHYRFFDITKSIFLISQNQFFDITKSIFYYHKIIFLISQIRFCDITQNRYFDITNFVTSKNHSDSVQEPIISFEGLSALSL